jgi:rRNA-processing protein FCF1
MKVLVEYLDDLQRQGLYCCYRKKIDLPSKENCLERRFEVITTEEVAREIIALIDNERNKG